MTSHLRVSHKYNTECYSTVAFQVIKKLYLFKQRMPFSAFLINGGIVLE